MDPLHPRITKSTAVAAIIARFPSTEELLKRFEIAKNQANLWDGERDGLREAVKITPSGQYGNVLLSKKDTAEVLYPNSSGKHQLENCLQCSIPASLAEGPVIAFIGTTPEKLLADILSELQHSKERALGFLKEYYLGSGTIVDNAELYEKKGGEKACITDIS